MYNYQDILNGNEIALANSVNTTPQVEPLQGPAGVEDIFDRFPESIYQQGIDTHLYHFLEALCGDAGAGILKKQSYRTRLSAESEYLTFKELDNFYGSTFRFGRIKTELYDINTDVDNITEEQWESIRAKDDLYKHRAQDFVNATRLGNTPDGMALAARSGSGMDAEIVENYKFIFNLYSDDPLNDLLPTGHSTSVNEFVVNSHIRDQSDDTVRTGDTSIGSTSVTNIFPSTVNLIPELAISGNNLPFNTTVVSIDSLTSITISKPASGSGSTDLRVISANSLPSPGLTFKTPIRRVFNTANDTLRASFDTSHGKSALRKSMVDTVSLTPSETSTSLPIQYASQKIYVKHLTKLISSVDWDVSPGLDPEDPDTFAYTFMLPEVERNMLESLDRLRPAGALISMEGKSSHNIPIQLNATPFASSERMFLSRFVNGSVAVDWPTPSNRDGAFIVAGEEREMIHGNNARELPVIFHTIESANAYTDLALLDSMYDTAEFFIDPYGVRSAPFYAYQSEYVGPFSKMVQRIFPTLRKLPVDSLFTYSASRAIALRDTPLILEGRV